MVRVCSSADGSAQCVLEGLLVFLLCPKSSVYFETVTKSLLLSRQRCCRVSTKHLPLLSLCLATLPCLCLCVTGRRRAISFCKITPLNPYLSCFWTSLMLNSSSSYMTPLFSKLWLSFLVCKHNPRVKCTAPTAQHQPALLGWQELFLLFPRVHRRNPSGGEVCDFICYVNVFSLCS